MSAYTVRWKRSALKDLRGLPAHVVARTTAAVEALASEPRPPGARKLAGTVASYRVRIGEYRVVYTLYDDALDAGTGPSATDWLAHANQSPVFADLSAPEEDVYSADDGAPFHP